ncbi:CLUMA_CG017857, isoform A [Clunio marinus]|uniref:CLUMA_CG017857, isoform A n=1 Tax=Clunio marinus TaxID=568069 RepID=A0A1J1IWZ6_9DIPT|nr:CLUMA_CG017857, isoform A [Clunio marinus]
MINKTINNINCASIEEVTTVMDNMTTSLTTSTTPDPIKQLTIDVCKAETESQKLLSVVFGLRSPIAAIFPLIIVLFAGGWSDKKGIRKPLVLFPILGELIGSLILLLSSIFMNEIPMEVPAFSERVFPSLFGGQTLMLMGIYSYLTGVTTEENRTFRFGCFTVFFTLIPISSIPWSGFLFNALGYTKLFALCVLIYVLGILYIIFVLQEVKVVPAAVVEVKEKSTQEGIENPAFDADGNQVKLSNEANKDAVEEATGEVLKKGFFREFFDPTLAMALVEVVFKKLLGISDPMIGIISTIFTLISKPIYAFATTTLMFYTGTTVDLFLSTKAVAIKSIISKIIPSTELGRMFSVLGIIESVDTFIFPSIYSFVYLKTVEIFLGAIYFLSEFFFVLTLLMFIAIYLILRDNEKKNGDEEMMERYKKNPDLFEVTNL